MEHSPSEIFYLLKFFADIADSVVISEAHSFK